MSEPVTGSSPAFRIMTTVWAICLLAVALAAGEPGIISVATASSGPSNVSAAVARLADRDPRSRWQAVCDLGQFGPAADRAVPDLVRLLEDREEDEYVRGGAAWALGRIGPPARSAVPALRRVLQSQQVSVRRNAARSLGQLSVPDAAESLLPCLDDEDEGVRIQAAGSLWTLRREPKALAVLLAALRQSDAEPACEAAFTLGPLPDAPAVLPDLIWALRNGEDDLAHAAAWALGQRGAASVAALDFGPKDPDPAFRRRVVEALQWTGRPGLESLRKALADPEASVRRSAARALGCLGPEARSALPELLATLSDADAGVREETGRAVARIRGTAVPHPPCEDAPQ